MNMFESFALSRQGVQANNSPAARAVSDFSEIDFDYNYMVEKDIKPINLKRELSEDELIEDEGWNRASQTLYESYMGNRNLKGRNRARGASVPSTPQEYGAWGVEFIGQMNHNFTSMAVNVNRLRDMDNDTKFAMHHLFNEYERLPEFSWGGTQRFFKGVLTDPTTYVGLGTLGLATIGRAGAQQMSKGAFRSLLRGSLDPRLLAAYEGAGYVGADDAMRQSIDIQAGVQQELDLGQTLEAAAIGAVGGGGLAQLGKTVADNAPAIAGAIREGVSEMGAAADERIAQRAQDTSVTLSAGVDPMPAIDAALSAAGRSVRDQNDKVAGDAMAAQARYFETGNFEPPTAENPVSVVRPTETEPGIIAFHGSGADFDEFRLEMIGTGEGAQAYGYGLYFTDSEDIAKFYKDTVSTGAAKIPYGSAEDAAQAIPESFVYQDIDGYRSYAMGDAEEMISSVLTKQYFNVEPEQRIIDANLDVFERDGVLNIKMRDGSLVTLLRDQNGDRFTATPIKEKTGKMYKVGLAPKPEELLDHDAPFSQQSKDVQEKLIKAGYELDPRTSGSGNMIVEAIMSNIAKARLAGRDENLKKINARLSELAKEMDKYSSGYRDFNDPRGQVLADEYDALLVERENLPTMTMSRARKLASQELAKAGIPGIKYRAAGSRGTGVTDEAAERNYVIFDDKAIKILEKYGIVGPVSVSAVAASQNQDDDTAVANDI